MERPSHKRSLFEAFPLGDKLEQEGVAFAGLQAGQAFHYQGDTFSYVITILGQGELADGSDTRPLVKAESFLPDGSLHDSTGGLLYGVSLDGIGNLPVLHLPPDGDRFVTLVIETLPNEDSEPKRIIIKEDGLPLYD